MPRLTARSSIVGLSALCVPQAEAEAKRLEEIRAQEEAEYALLKQGIVVEQTGTDAQEADQVAALLGRMEAFIKASCRSGCARVAMASPCPYRRTLQPTSIRQSVFTLRRMSRWSRSTNSPANLGFACR